jgi:DNA-directed RNA polymerase specialized sigma24 family protein
MDVRSESETPRREVYEDLRPLLFSIAYRIVSSVSEAEDIVQEAFLRFHRAQSEGEDIDSPRAWLSTVTTRLAINQGAVGPRAAGGLRGHLAARAAADGPGLGRLRARGDRRLAVDGADLSSPAVVGR